MAADKDDDNELIPVPRRLLTELVQDLENVLSWDDFSQARYKNGHLLIEAHEILDKDPKHDDPTRRHQRPPDHDAQRAA